MKDFILPDIGEGIVECELLKWLVAEGDVIKEDQAVAEVMTDKATVEIPAMYDGVVKKLYYKEGDIAKVHAPLFAMESADDSSVSENVQTSEVRQSNKQEGSHNPQSDSDEQSAGKQIESFVLPDIGEGIVECEIVKWSVAEGDTVEEDQVVVEVMTDKAVVEIPAKHAGKILTLHYKQGDIAKVHSPLFEQEIDGDGTTTSAASLGDASRSGVRDDKARSSDTQANPSSVSDHDHSQLFASNRQGENFEAPVVSEKPIASPAVRRLARELNLNLNTIAGSGKKGRIVKSDIESAVSASQIAKTEKGSATSSSVTNSQSSATAQVSASHTEGDRVEAIKGIRAAMAKQMVASVSTIPHFTVSDELRMDNLIALRQQLKPDFEAQGVKLSFMPFFIKALSLAMQAFPIINSRLNEDASELTYLSAHNIGVAVDSKIGLLVPNIKNVQNLSLLEVAQELNRLIDSAREGKLSNADLSGGTISISNIGAIGGITATPVINKPDVAIVALGKTQRLPRFADDGAVEAHNIMMVNWSGDHRVIDGASMVKFNNLWMDYLAHPQKMLMKLR